MTEEKSIAISLLEKTVEKLQSENHLLIEENKTLKTYKETHEKEITSLKQRIEWLQGDDCGCEEYEECEEPFSEYFNPENLDHEMKLELLEEADILNKYNYLQLKELLSK